jgi:hypothetical protein
MPRKRRSGAQQRAHKAAKRHEAKCQNERFRRDMAVLHARRREIVERDHDLFCQLLGGNTLSSSSSLIALH